MKIVFAISSPLIVIYPSLKNSRKFALLADSYKIPTNTKQIDLRLKEPYISKTKLDT